MPKFNINQRFKVIDLLLTGHADNYDPEKYKYIKETDPEKWLYSGDVWYLSDGGYSRIGYSFDTGHLFLTYNSTERVAEKWNLPRVQELILALEKDLMDLRKELGE